MHLGAGLGQERDQTPAFFGNTVPDFAKWRLKWRTEYAEHIYN